MNTREIAKACKDLVAAGDFQISGKNAKGEILYSLTPQGKANAEKMIEEMTRKPSVPEALYYAIARGNEGEIYDRVFSDEVSAKRWGETFDSKFEVSMGYFTSAPFPGTKLKRKPKAKK